MPLGAGVAAEDVAFSRGSCWGQLEWPPLRPPRHSMRSMVNLCRATALAREKSFFWPFRNDLADLELLHYLSQAADAGANERVEWG